MPSKTLHPSRTEPNSFEIPCDNTHIATFAHAIPLFRVIGEALNMYIIVEYQDNVWFIDKHAAHERILFDKLRNGEYSPMSEALITPVICRLGHTDVSLLLENADFLDKLGFSIESFGEDALAVRYIPAEIDIGDTESVLSEMCSGLCNSGTTEPVGLDAIFKLIACKAAIKAGRSSDSRELESLATKVLAGEVSFCPHGRPVAFEITKQTLDKGFKRL
jgi:DNA mismatch repair protein MutL